MAYDDLYDALHACIFYEHNFTIQNKHLIIMKIYSILQCYFNTIFLSDIKI